MLRTVCPTFSGLVLLIAVACLAVGQQVNPEEKRREDMGKRRRDKLLVELRKGDNFCSETAADELVALGKLEKRHWEALIEVLAPNSRRPPLSPPYIEALAMAGPPAIPDI